MNQRDISFTVENVRKTRAGEKTETRRLVDMRDVGYIGSQGEEADPEGWGYALADGRWGVLARGHHEQHQHGLVSIRCPYGVPGDRLRVLEPIQRGPRGLAVYAADQISTGKRWTWKNKGLPGRYMPRDLSRLLLQVEEVRVERLHEITTAGIIAEGINVPAVDYSVSDHPDALDAERDAHARKLWIAGWDRINGKRSPWSSNPWVWVIVFSRERAGKKRGAA